MLTDQRRSHRSVRFPTASGTMEGFSFGYRKVTSEEKDRLVKEHFDSIAAKYDVMNSFLSLGLHHLWKRKAMGALNLAGESRVLDVCGGTADLALIAARTMGGTGEIIVYDINRAMMEAGRPKVVRSGIGEQVTFVQGDAETISFGDCSFDAVTVGFGIRNLTHLEKGLQEIHRVLKRGGEFMCLEFSQPTSRLFRLLYDFYSFVWMPLAGQIFAGTRKAYTYLPESIRVFPTPDHLIRMLQAIGFTEIEHTYLTNGIASIYLAKKF
jgi:demethylmenaquinone methyltransferase / 2-methoxy-6-polyprenyl-1,4-benzoquinol methylase